MRGYASRGRPTAGRASSYAAKRSELETPRRCGVSGRKPSRPLLIGDGEPNSVALTWPLKRRATVGERLHRPLRTPGLTGVRRFFYLYFSVRVLQLARPILGAPVVLLHGLFRRSCLALRSPAPARANRAALVYFGFAMRSGLMPGQVAGKKYLLEEYLGDGGMAEVWGAVNQSTGRKVALKVLKVFSQLGREARERFQQEAVRTISHPHVVHVYDLDQLDDDKPFIIMERLFGKSLRDCLLGHGALPLERAANILLQATSAVGAAHAANIVHRDLTPANLFLLSSPPDFVKVLDFGIAKLLSFDAAGEPVPGLTRTRALMGTPGYMAPEQALTTRRVDFAADVWALGVILYECLAGQRLWSAPKLSDKDDDLDVSAYLQALANISPLIDALPTVLPESLRKMLVRALSVDHRGRASLAEMFDALCEVASVRVPPIAPPGSKPLGAPSSAAGAVTMTSERTQSHVQTVDEEEPSLPVGPLPLSIPPKEIGVALPEESSPAPVAEKRSPSRRRKVVAVAAAALTVSSVAAALELSAFRSDEGHGSDPMAGNSIAPPLASPDAAPAIATTLSPIAAVSTVAANDPSPTVTSASAPKPSFAPASTHVAAAPVPSPPASSVLAIAPSAPPSSAPSALSSSAPGSVLSSAAGQGRSREPDGVDAGRGVIAPTETFDKQDGGAPF